MKQTLINRRQWHNFMDELACLLIVLLEVLSFLIILYFSINVAFSSDTQWSDRQHREISLAEVTQGMLLYKTDTVGRYIPAATVSTDVDIKVTGMIARAKITQQFKNNSMQWLEGLYVFPLPEDAAVDHMKMYVGSRIIEGKIKPREEARKIYNKAKQQGKKASLVEQQRPNMFRNTIANIGPGETIKVVIEYQQNIQYQFISNQDIQKSTGEFNMRFPMAINPRYIPGKVINEKTEITSANNSAGRGWAMNTQQVADASYITPPVSTEKINKINLRVELDAGFDIETIRSDYHRVSTVNHGAGKYTVTLLPGNSEKANYADRDFSLRWQTAIGKQPRAAVFSQQHKGEYYHLLMVMPPTDISMARTRLSREVIYIIDTSGSMAGTSIRQARKALLLAIDQLSAKETFNIIEFNSSAHKLFGHAVNASHRNKVAARRFIKSLQADGGTEMASALNLAFDQQTSHSETGKIRQVIFLTDGSVGNEDSLFKLIKSRLGESRLFTVGIGSAPNSYFMTKAAKHGRGTFTYIGNVNEVQQKMAELFSKLESPVLKNLKINYNTAEKVEAWPEKQPDLYLGEPVIIAVKSKEALDKIDLTAELNNSQWNMQLKISDTAQASDVGVLWARKKISSLMDSLYEGAEKQKVKKQVTEVALNHHLVSKYTSLVAVDITPSRPLNELLNKHAFKVNLPADMIYKKVFGSMAQTATTAELNLLFGITLLLVALISSQFNVIRKITRL